MQTVYGLGIAAVGIALCYFKINILYGSIAFLVGITMALGPNFMGTGAGARTGAGVDADTG